MNWTKEPNGKEYTVEGATFTDDPDNAYTAKVNIQVLGAGNIRLLITVCEDEEPIFSLVAPLEMDYIKEVARQILEL